MSKKHILLIFLCGVALGCATTDTARRVQRQCPVKRVYGNEADKVVRDQTYFDGKHVYIVGNCMRDSKAIAHWCKAKGIEYTEESVTVKYGKRLIPRGHVQLVVNGSTINYVDGLGVVASKKEYKESKK